LPSRPSSATLYLNPSPAIFTTALMRALLAVLLLPAFLAAGDYSPDPKSVRRHGPAYRYPQAGWIVLHVEGKPYERGFQHGSLMATEIAAYVRCFAAQLGSKDPAGAWAHTRRLTSALFLRKFDREYLEEMQGIADGAAEAGAKYEGKALDLTDIAAVNCWAEIESLDSGLEALPTGLEGQVFPGKKPKAMPPAKAEHCSAFAATGPATADGKIVFGHITMFGLYPSRYYNVWLDVKPEKGHRVLMQSYPGGIQSGMDYYLNDAGLIVCETTIDQTRFRADGMTLASRIRKALQYGDKIDDVVKTLSDGNNGLYTNEWLIADTKTNEIAMFELGTTTTKLWRSSKNEWYGGTDGFYWGCNNTKDLQVRLDTIADLGGRPQSTAWVPSSRDQKWLDLYARGKGKIDAEWGKMAFSTPPLCAASSLDAKVTTTELMKQLKTHAIFGPPIGGTWEPSDHEKSEYPDIVPLVPNDWTVLHPGAPPKADAAKIADLSDKAEGYKSIAERLPDGIPITKAAWHGTLLAKSDADLWLTEGFVAYERIVAFEQSLVDSHDDGKLTAEDKDRLFVELNLHQATLRRSSANSPAAERRRFVHEETARGVLRLAGLRHKLGDRRFLELMDAFGRDRAGQKVTAEEFVTLVNRSFGKNAPGDPETWASLEEGPKFTIRNWVEDQENTIIVYGTAADQVANHETAQRLQKTVRHHGTNIVLPILSDVRALAAPGRLAGKHVLLIGSPATNKLAHEWQKAFAVKFGPASFQVRDETFAHAGSAVVAAGENPLDRARSVVLIAGLSAESTRFALDFALNGGVRAGNVLVIPNQAKARSLVVK
jgi:Phospholipase B